MDTDLHTLLLLVSILSCLWWSCCLSLPASPSGKAGSHLHERHISVLFKLCCLAVPQTALSEIWLKRKFWGFKTIYFLILIMAIQILIYSQLTGRIPMAHPQTISVQHLLSLFSICQPHLFLLLCCSFLLYLLPCNSPKPKSLNLILR